jgi:hypothetical protein
MAMYLFEIRVLFAIYFGWVLREPNEYEDVEDMNMNEFLKLKL